MLQSRDYPTAAVVVAALDLDEVHAALALMFRRKSMRVHVSVAEAAPPTTTTRQPPALRHAGHGGPGVSPCLVKIS